MVEDAEFEKVSKMIVDSLLYWVFGFKTINWFFEIPEISNNRLLNLNQYET